MFATSSSMARTRMSHTCMPQHGCSLLYTKQGRFPITGQHRRMMTLRDIALLKNPTQGDPLNPLPHPQPKELIVPGVTKREYTLPEGPAKGLPLIQLFFRETHTEDELIRGHQKSYNKEGYLVREHVLNETDVVQLFFWEYKNNRLMCAWTPHGTIQYEEYDDKGNPIKEKFIELGLVRHNRFDARNRLISSQEVDQHGQTRTFRYAHHEHEWGQWSEVIDSNNHRTVFHEPEKQNPNPLSSTPLLQEVPFENTTYYVLNVSNPDFHASDLPSMLHIGPQDLAQFHEILVYNTQKCILFSQGSYGTREYTPFGTLKKAISPLGHITEYTNDPLGRAITIKEWDSTAKLLSTIHVTYKGLLPISETHDHGDCFTYEYDRAERLTRKRRNKVLILEHFYDSLGRKVMTIDSADSTCPKVIKHIYDGPGPKTQGHGRFDHYYCHTPYDHELPYEAQVTLRYYNAWGELTREINLRHGRATHNVQSGGQSFDCHTGC